MKRTRAVVGVWPAFADLMAVFAVVGLLATQLLQTELRSQVEEVRRAQSTIASLTSTAGELRAALTAAETRLITAEAELKKARGIDAPPCLGQRGRSPQPLLHVTTTGREYDVTAAWPSDQDRVVRAIPGVTDAVAAGRMTVHAFVRSASAIYDYGADAGNAFGRSCRFYVELKRGRISRSEFVTAYALMTRYFFIANAAEVTRGFAGSE